MLQLLGDPILPLIAVTLPFLIVWRWSGDGFFLAVIGVWILIFASSWIGKEVSMDDDMPRTYAVFMGLWLLIGLPIAIAWTGIVAFLLFLVTTTAKAIRNDLRAAS